MVVAVIATIYRQWKWLWINIETAGTAEPGVVQVSRPPCYIRREDISRYVPTRRSGRRTVESSAVNLMEGGSEARAVKAVPFFLKKKEEKKKLRRCLEPQSRPRRTVNGALRCAFHMRDISGPPPNGTGSASQWNPKGSGFGGGICTV